MAPAPVAVAPPAMATPKPSPEPWGRLKGRVVWGPEKIPERKPIPGVAVNADKNHCLKDGPIYDETWVVNPKNRGLRWTLVWLINDDPKDETPLPIHPRLKEPAGEVVIDTPRCMFVPQVVGLREGQTLVIKNSSPVSHGPRLSGPQNRFGVSIPATGEFKLKDLIAVRIPMILECAIHPWMTARVGVFSHPYFAVTDENGNFDIPIAPAGKYRLIVYNNLYSKGAAGRNGEPVTIVAGGIADLGTLTFVVPEGTD
jgi:hypothetical protein